MSPRAAITIIFILNGVALGTWGSRIPAIKDRIDVGTGGLALPLAAIAAGALLAMPAGGRFASRHGSRVPATLAIAALGALLVALGLLPSLAAVAVAALAFGASNGALDVAMNAQGVSVERRLGRPVLSSLHAGFSFGALLGAAGGALAAALAVGPAPTSPSSARRSSRSASGAAAASSMTGPTGRRPSRRTARRGAGACGSWPSAASSRRARHWTGAPCTCARSVRRPRWPRSPTPGSR